MPRGRKKLSDEQKIRNKIARLEKLLEVLKGSLPKIEAPAKVKE
jgi:hypothetical protein